MVAGRPGAPTFACEIYCATQGSSTGKEASKPLAIKSSGVCGSRRNSQPHRRVRWRDPQGCRKYTNPPTQESAPEGHNLLVGSREVTEGGARAEQAALFPWTPPPHIVPQCSHVGCPTLVNEYLRFHPLQHNSCAKTKKYGQNERTNEITKRELSDEEDSQPIRCRVQNIGNQDAHK